MKYQLICLGRLRRGVQEEESVAQIMRITKLSEEQVRQLLLIGKAKKLTSSPDKAKLDELYRALKNAGLEVEIRQWVEKGGQSQKNSDSSRAMAEATQPQPNGYSGRRWAAISLLLLFIFSVGAAGYVWHWLHRSLPTEVTVAENALFDGNLVAIALVDVEKLVALERYWFGGIDVNALPVDEEKKGLLEELFSGPAGFKDNLRQVVFSVNLDPGEKIGKSVMLLSGQFNAEALMGSLNSVYTLEKISKSRWSVIKKEQPQSDTVCKKDEQKNSKPKTLYLQISPEWVMLFDDQAHGDNIWGRLRSSSDAEQDAGHWRQFRQGQLLSFMAIAPAQAGMAVGGMPGMMAHGVATETPQVTAVAAAVGVEPLKGGLNANFHLVSDDVAWNGATESKIRQKLEQMEQDSRSVSPTLAGLVSRVVVTSQASAVDIDVSLDSQLLNDAGQIVQEGFGSLFSVGMSGGGSAGGVPQESINNAPSQYVNLDLSQLPALKLNEHQTPLFSQDPFAVDLMSIGLNNEGLLELWLEGKVGLPDNKDRRFDGIGELSLSVSSVQDAVGQEMLRDELCLNRNDLFGKSPNHEIETNANHHQNHGWVWKHVRLMPHVTIEQIARIKGQLGFSVPTRVRKFNVPLRAGEVIEHAGVRFYLSSIKKDAISYQISGKAERLLEVRGLNKDGKVLRQGWKMSSMEGGQSTQNYQGEVQKLELYIAEQYFQQKIDFELHDLFVMPEKEVEKTSPKWFAPEKMDVQRWRDYSRLNMNGLKIDPKKDWHIWEKNIAPIAEGSWAPIRMFLTHKPAQWGNYPVAHMYFPMLPELPGVLSAFSYRVDEPAVKDGAAVRYEMVSYPYYSNSGKIVVEHEIKGQPMAVKNFSLASGLDDNQRLERLTGEIIFRLPKKTQSTKLTLNRLWGGQTVDGITVTLTEVKRGMFPGYGLKIEGAIEKLVNLHGLSIEGDRVMASPVNFQNAGYWTMTLPINRGIEKIELITASVQDVLHYPFDFTPSYPVKEN